jgi:hypothetical protein
MLQTAPITGEVSAAADPKVHAVEPVPRPYIPEIRPRSPTMRATFALALLALAGPAMAQESNGSLDVQTVNGVRVWRPKAAPPPVVVPPAAPRSTTVVVVNTPPAAAEAGEVIGLPVGLPFVHNRPHARPSLPHGRPQRPHGVPHQHPGRRF